MYFDLIKFKKKIILGASLPIILFICLSFYLFMSIEKLSLYPIKMYKHPFAVSNSVRDIKIKTYKVQNIMNQTLIQKDLNPSFIVRKSDLNVSLDEINQAFNLIDERFLGDKNKIKKARFEYENWLGLIDKFYKKLDKKELQNINNHLEKKVLNEIEYLLAFAANKGMEFDESAKATQSNLTKITIVSIVLITFISMIILLIVTGKVEKSLSAIIISLSDVFEKLKGTAKELESKEKALLESLSEEASSLDSSSSSLEEINQMLKSGQSITSKALEVSKRSELNASNGKKSLIDMIESVESVENNLDSLSDQLTNYEVNLKKILNIMTNIDSKTKVINDIVFQTKLLSFNASVEAARAGEAGKGFSVVAEEIGTLATTSGEAASEINEILMESSNEIEQMISIFDKEYTTIQNFLKSAIESSRSTTNACDDSLSLISSNISEMHSLMTSIVRSYNEQSVGSSEISKSISTISEISSLNTSNAKINVKLCKDISRNSDVLSESINLLKKEIGIVS